jgi:site-specific DNA-methyltransferase (adenine-specific)
MEGMKSIPDKYFELAIVDPPYGINVANMNMGIGNSPKASKLKNRKWISKNWDLHSPNLDYFNELFRVSKNQIIWGGNYFELGSCKHYIIWDKVIPKGLSFADCEMAWTSFLTAPRIFKYSAYLDKIHKIHPTQKPVKLYEWLLKNYAKKGDKILDTHLGSGSSRIAAYKLGFDFWGYEIDPDYFKESDKRFLREKQMVPKSNIF